MPARKTFNSIRVRGVVRFDTRPTSQGIVMPLYKHYVGLFAQEEDQPPYVNVLENTLGAPMMWTRGGTGFYLGRLDNAFPMLKTAVFVSPVYLEDWQDIHFSGSWYSDHHVSFTFFRNGEFSDGITPVLIEIRVYP